MIVYDEIDDSSLNALLWNYSTSTNPVTENNDYIEIQAKSIDTTPAKANLTSSSLPNIVNIYSFNTTIYGSQVKSDNCAGGGGGVVEVFIFGKNVMSIGCDDSAGTTRNVYLIANLTNVSTYDVYYDGVYQTTFTPTSSLFNMSVDSLASTTPTIESTSIARVYFVKYSLFKNYSSEVLSFNVYSPIIWNIQSCDNNSVCSFGTSNRTLFLDYPNFTIISPSTTTASSSILINATIDSISDLSICKYWIMRGASTEKANATINCSQFNETYTLSGQADYVLYLWANQSGNIINTTTFNFTYFVAVGGGGGGGGGTRIIEILQNITTSKICLGTDTKFREEYSKWRVNIFDWTNFKTMWYALWNESNCVSSASLISI